jgi:hypothetical protein
MVSLHLRAVVSYPTLSGGGCGSPASAGRESSPTGPPKPRLLDRVRMALRVRHYSRRTEEAYVPWIKRYILFHGKRHPAEMGAPEVTRFLARGRRERRGPAGVRSPVDRMPEA